MSHTHHDEFFVTFFCPMALSIITLVPFFIKVTYESFDLSPDILLCESSSTFCTLLFTIRLLYRYRFRGSTLSRTVQIRSFPPGSSTPSHLVSLSMCLICVVPSSPYRATGTTPQTSTNKIHVILRYIPKCLPFIMYD